MTGSPFTLNIIILVFNFSTEDKPLTKRRGKNLLQICCGKISFANILWEKWLFTSWITNVQCSAKLFVPKTMNFAFKPTCTFRRVHWVLSHALLNYPGHPRDGRRVAASTPLTLLTQLLLLLEAAAVAVTAATGGIRQEGPAWPSALWGFVHRRHTVGNFCWLGRNGSGIWLAGGSGREDFWRQGRGFLPPHLTPWKQRHLTYSSLKIFKNSFQKNLMHEKLVTRMTGRFDIIKLLCIKCQNLTPSNA